MRLSTSSNPRRGRPLVAITAAVLLLPFRFSSSIYGAEGYTYYIQSVQSTGFCTNADLLETPANTWNINGRFPAARCDGCRGAGTASLQWSPPETRGEAQRRRRLCQAASAVGLLLAVGLNSLHTVCADSLGSPPVMGPCVGPSSPVIGIVWVLWEPAKLPEGVRLSLSPVPWSLCSQTKLNIGRIEQPWAQQPRRPAKDLIRRTWRATRCFVVEHARLRAYVTTVCVTGAGEFQE